jgi:hypothetical protein
MLPVSAEGQRREEGRGREIVKSPKCHEVERYNEEEKNLDG